MSHHRSLALSLLLAAAPAAAQTGTPPAGPSPAVPAMSAEAREALGIASDAVAAEYAAASAEALAFRLDAADAAFAALGERAPDSPVGAFGRETVALWRSLVTEDDDHFDRFYALNDSVTALAERAGDAPGAPLVVAAAKLHRAFAFGRQERYTRAANSFREACGRFGELDGPDAWFGQGICEVAAGAIPRKYRWLARLVGFRGTVSGGLAKLEYAADGDGAFAVEAAIALAATDASLNEFQAGGVDRLVASAEARPASPILDYVAAYLLMIDRRAAEAEVLIRRAIDGLGAEGVEPVPFVDAHLGLILFRQHRFEEAAELLERFVRSYRGRALVSHSTLHAGLAYELTGDRRRAEALYRRVRASRDYDSDLSAAREAERRLDHPLTATDRALVLGGAAFDAGRYDEAVRFLQPVVTDRDLPAADRAEAAYRTGRARQAQEDWDDALRHFQLAIDRPGDPLAKWGPWSLYHAGEVHEATGDLDAAAARYQQVLENETEFDYHKSLEQRTRAALERIGR